MKPFEGWFWSVVALVSGVVAAGSVGAAEMLIHLEIVQAARGSVDGPARWTEGLQRLPLASLRVRPARPGERPRVEQRGTPQQPTFHVTAILSDRNELQVPGTTFRVGQWGRISRWLEQLRPDGEIHPTLVAFGLTAAEFDQLKQTLSTPWRRSTAEWPLRSVVAQLQERLPLSLTVDPTARAALSRPTPVDEYQGLAEGTVLAASLQSAGLGFVPARSQRGSITLTIVAAASVNESWPIGWTSSERLQDLVPKLFEFVPVEIADTPLSQALAAIEPRLGVPMLMDRAGMAARQIDLDAVKVNYPAGRTFYKKLLDRLLFQARLKVAIRVDEAGHPFLWIEPIGR